LLHGVFLLHPRNFLQRKHADLHISQ
jgi:hypothetical protein